MVMLVYLCVELITQGIRIYIVLPKINMKYSVYIKEIILPLVIPLIALLIPCYIFNESTDASFCKIIIYIGGAFLYMFFIILSLGLNNEERSCVLQFLNKWISLCLHH